MLVVKKIKPPTRTKTHESAYTSEELAAYFKTATKRLMDDIRAIERAEQESWAKVRNHEIS